MTIVALVMAELVACEADKRPIAGVIERPAVLERPYFILDYLRRVHVEDTLASLGLTQAFNRVRDHEANRERLGRFRQFRQVAQEADPAANQRFRIGTEGIW